MFDINSLLNDYIFDSENFDANLKLGIYYDSIGQTAAAISYYLRSAERTESDLMKYQIILKTALCFERQGCRNFTVKGLFQHALSIIPTRPEAYYFLSKFYEREQNYHDSYLIASLGEKNAKKDCDSLELEIDYPGFYGILFEKAVSSWWCGLCDESRDIFINLKKNYKMNDEHIKSVNSNLEMLQTKIKDLHPIYNKENLDDFDWGPTDEEYRTLFTKENFVDRIYEKHFLVQENDIVMDLGANCGSFTYSIFRHNPQHIYCIEPSPKLVKALKNNTSTNENKVTIIDKAISDHESESEIIPNTDVYVYCNEEEHYSTTTFSNIIKKYNIPKIDLLKFDCEGGEYFVFTKENVDYIRNNVKRITGEFHITGWTNSIEKFKIFRDYYLKDIRHSNALHVYERCGKDVTQKIFDDEYLKDFVNWWSSTNPYFGHFMVYVDYEKANLELNTKNITKTKVLDAYYDYDKRYGKLWGFCTENKAGCLIDYIDDICSKKSNPLCVEIGVYGGKSVLPVALELKRHKKGIIHTIDPWCNEEATRGYFGENYTFWNNIDLQKYYNIFLTSIEEFGLNEYVNVIKSTSDDAPTFSEIDFLYVDGQHTEQALKDVNKYATQVSLNGYCLIDDVNWDGVSNVPKEVEKLGFELINTVDYCYVYKRTSKKKNFDEQKHFIVNPKSKNKNSLWVVDNFYRNPEEIREFALNQDYVEGGIGKGFIGRRSDKQFLFPELKSKFEEIMGKKIAKWEDYGMNGRFQIAWAGEPLVYHCDSQKWGGMLYLTPDAPYQCGTTLYAHKKTRARTYYDEGWDASWKDVPGDAHLDGTHFEPVDVIGNVFNRLVIFDASCIHSASEYFGTVGENARLWQMFFFDT